MFVNGVGCAVGSAGANVSSLFLGVVHGHLAARHLHNELFGLVDAVVHAGEEDGLAVEAGSLHVLVRRHDDAVTGGDLFLGQDVLRAVGAVGLDLDGQFQLVTRLGQRLGGHISMSDAVGAGGHGQHPETVLGDGLAGEALVAELVLLLLVDAVEEFLRRLGGAELFYEVFVHQHLHHPGQHIHVEAAVLRGRNGEEQVGLAVVIGVVLHRLLQPQHGQTGVEHHVALGVGHGNAVVHIGGAFRLAGIERLFVGGLVHDVVMSGLQLHQLVQDLLLRGSGGIQCNGLEGK